jgi:WD40 repeat protein
VVNVSLNPVTLISDRHHPELTWHVIESEHFVWYYHEGLERTARQSAAIGEAIYGPVTRSFRTVPRRKTEVVLTSTDQIANGLTLPWDRIYLWVPQNDYIEILSGQDKWLRAVIAHEFQHVVLLNALRTWPGPEALLLSSPPAWYVEGCAEYFTESWGVTRSDWPVRTYIYANTVESLDPHHQGFAKVKYLAWQKGDSALVALAKYRGAFGLHRWDDAFRKTVGESETEWTERWRRAMNAYYYGFYAAKESADSIGTRIAQPVRAVAWAAFAPDSSVLGVAGRLDGGVRDAALYTVRCDREQHVHENTVFSPLDPKVAGRYGRTFAWSPDAREIVLSRYHRGSHGAMLLDLYRTDARGRRGRWLTHDARAEDPDWSPDGSRIAYVVTTGETANLWFVDVASGAARQLTHFTGDVQITHPSWSPDGRWLACALFDTTRGSRAGADIVAIRADSEDMVRITNDPEVDRTPFWSRDGRYIYFTSYRDGTANIYRTSVSFDSLRAGHASRAFDRRTVRVTDAGEGVVAFGLVPKSDSILAITLGSERKAHLLAIHERRVATVRPYAIRSEYRAWIDRGPAIFPGPGNPDSSVSVAGPRPYHALSYLRPEAHLFVPYPFGLVYFGLLSDPLAYHELDLDAYAGAGSTPSAGIALTYRNAAGMLPWVATMDVHNPVAELRIYSGRLLTEQRSGASVGFRLPFGGGLPLEDAQEVTGRLALRRRVAGNRDAFAGRALPPPENGREGVGSFGYMRRSERPRKDGIIHPFTASGLRVNFEAADSSLWGDVSYRRYTLEAFAVRPLLASSGVTVSARVHLAGTDGRPFRQDVVGLTNDFPLIVPLAQQLLRSSFSEPRTVDRLRGQKTVRLGNRLAFASAEFRLPLMNGLPVEAFGFRVGAITAAFFADGGTVWTTGRGAERWETTVGAEIKNVILLGPIPAVAYAIGVGAPASTAFRSGDAGRRVFYWQLSAGTPF